MGSRSRDRRRRRSRTRSRDRRRSRTRSRDRRRDERRSEKRDVEEGRNGGDESVAVKAENGENGTAESGEDQDLERGRDHAPDPGRDLRDLDPEEEDLEAEIEDVVELAPEIGEDPDLEITRVRRAREIEMRGRRSEEIMIRRSRDSNPRKKRSMKQLTWKYPTLLEEIFDFDDWWCEWCCTAT